MEWQQIIGFYQLVKQGSFTRAADASYRTQSALSQQVRKLEEEFQCRLVNRISRRKFTLTPAGERVYRFAVSLLGEYERLGDDLSEIRGLPRGRLKIAAPFTTLYHLFPEQFRAFLKAYPFVELTILDRPQGQAVEMVKAGEIDIAIVLESHAPKGLDIRRWKQVETVLILPDKHPLLKKEEITPADIAVYPLILPPQGTESRRLMEDLFQEKGLRYRVIMESTNVELSSLYVEAGIGISFASIASGLDPLRGRKIRFLALTEYFGSDYLAVVSGKGVSLPLYAQDFIAMVLGDAAGRQPAVQRKRS